MGVFHFLHLYLITKNLKTNKTYRHKWKYNDNERPEGCCYDCRMKYGEFPDMTINDEYWEKINPTEHKGAGLLCPTCIANRLNYLGLWYKENKKHLL